MSEDDTVRSMMLPQRQVARRRTAEVNAVNRASWLISLGLLMVCLSTSVMAVSVDDFSADQGPLSLTDPGSGAGDTAFSFTSDGTIVGNERTLRLRLIEVAATEGTQVEVTGGQLLFSADAASRGQVDIGYDGETGDPDSPLDVAVGLGGVDLTAGNHSGIRLAVASTTAAGMEVEMEIHSSATQSSRFVLRLPLVAAPQDFICSFSDFVDTGSGGGADFSAVTAILLRLRGTGVGVTLDGLETVGAQVIQGEVTNVDTHSDSDVDGFADPGETVKYTITLSNNGAEAQSVSLGDLLDPNVTGQTMTLFTTPIAQRDTYQGCGNASLNVDVGNGLLANDFDPDGDSTLPNMADPLITVTATNTSLTQGTVMVNADGSFAYEPPAGFQGVDTFAYTVTDDDGRSSTGQVAVLVTGVVWFIDDDDDTGPFEGTQSNPFNDLLDVQAASAPGDILYVVSDDGTVDRLTQSIVLKDDQQLIGGGVALTACGLNIAAGTTPGITDTTSEPFVGAGKGRRAVPSRRTQSRRQRVADKGIVALPVVTLANRNIIRGIRLEATLASALDGVGVTDLTSEDVVIDRTSFAEGIIFDGMSGTVVFDDLTMQGAPISTGLILVDSNADIDFNNASFGLTTGGLAYIENDASSLDFTGGTLGLSAGSTFPALEMFDNTGTYNFATLGAIITSDAGIVADNGGVLSLPATATVTSTGGPALEAINGTVFGSDPLIFASLSASGTSNGITVADVAEALTVTGAVTVTSTGSGLVASNTGTLTMGTASNSIVSNGGPALDLNNANVALTFDTLSSTGSGAEGIDLDGVTGSVVVTNGASQITNASAASAVDIDGGSGTFTYPGAITKTGTGRSVSVQNRSAGTTTFSGAVDDDGGGVRLASNSGATVTFSGGLDIDSGSSTGFSATGGGTVNVLAGAVTNTIDVVGAPHALDLNGISIGTGDMTFTGINAMMTTAEGLDIDAVSNVGSFFGGAVTVNGTGVGTAGIDINNSSASFDFTSATIDSTGGAGINLAGGSNGVIVFDTVDIDATGGIGLQIGANTASVLIDAGSIGATTSANGDSVEIFAGSGNITIDASLRQTLPGQVVDVQSRSGGTVLFNGAITSSSGGITLTANTPSSNITFRGGMALDTGSNQAFHATGGTVNVCATTLCSGGGSAVQNTLGANSSLSARAVNIDGATLGGEGATFRSISVDGTITAAIVLANSGAGTFTVTGDGTTSVGGNASGGILENISNADAIILNNTGGLVSFQNLVVEDISHPSDAGDAIGTRRFADGIHGQDVNGGLRLQSVTMRRFSDHAVLGALFSDGTGFTSWNGLEIRDSVFENSNRFHVANRGDDADEGMIRVRGLTGTMVMDNSQVRLGGRGLDIYTPSGAGSLDATVQRSTFENLYKEFASGATRNVGGRGISFEANGSHDMVVRIGDPAQANPALGNTFLNNFTASVVVLGQEGGMTPHTGNIDTVISRNTFTITDHTTAQLPPGNLTFDFPQGGVSLNPAGGTFDAIVSFNLFDEVMHAAGGLGQLTLGLNGGAVQAHVHDNTFRLPWDGSVQIRAEGTSSAAVLFENNTYVDGMVGGASDDVGFAAQSPFNPFLVNVRGGGVMDLTLRDEDFPQHDIVFTPADRKHSIEVEVQADSGANALDLHLQGNTGPEGYHLKQLNGSFELFQGVSGSSAPATIIGDNGNTGGGSNPATVPPTVVVAGTVTATGTAPDLPVIVIP